MEEVSSSIKREITLDNREEMSEICDDDICSGFEEVFVRAAESVEIDHDFGSEIRYKREAEKERMMRDI
jgi:hypothetical protein